MVDIPRHRGEVGCARVHIGRQPSVLTPTRWSANPQPEISAAHCRDLENDPIRTVWEFR